MPSFEVGCFFPYSEIEVDPVLMRGFARSVEAMGYDYLANADHVIGVNRASRPDWPGHYDVTERFYDPLMLFSHLAAVTERIQFISSVIVAPQRQTVLLAQQAANLDVYCNGRLKLGFSPGWNAIESEALGMSFADRGARFNDQIPLLRRLWSEPHVVYKSEFHDIPDCGLTVPPIQRPIPIIVAGNAPVAMRRAARLGDGWMPFLTADNAAEKIGRYHDAVLAEGRDPADAPLYVLVHLGSGKDGAGDGTFREPEQVAEDVETWREVGARAALINSMERDLNGAAAHLDAFGRIAELLKLPPN